MATDKVRVLIADDESHIRYVLKTVARKEGMDVVGEAGNGEEAVELFRQHKPDLLLLDVNMPLKNGDEALLDVLREFPAAKVVMLTMVADADVVQRCLDERADDHGRHPDHDQGAESGGHERLRQSESRGMDGRLHQFRSTA